MAQASERSSEREDTNALGFKRHFVAPGLVLTALEIIAIVWPLVSLFQPVMPEPGVLIRIAIPVLIGAQLAWWSAVGAWLGPIYRAIQIKRRGKRLPDQLAMAAYRATWRTPRRALFLRTGLWMAVAAVHGAYWTRYGDWTARQVFELAAVAGVHAFAVNLARSIWYQAILMRLRQRLFASVPRIERFADGYYGALVHVSLVVSGLTAAAVAAFAYFFLPISLEQYLGLQQVIPLALAAAAAGMAVHIHRACVPVSRYLARTDNRDRDPGESHPGPDGVSTVAVYRRAQALPYRFAMAHLGLWASCALVSGWLVRSRLGFDLDDTVLLLGIWVDIALGASIFQVLWHRETMRPLLEEITLVRRVPVRAIRPTLSLRAKLLLSFGGMVLFAVALALFWAFIQYKNLVTEFTSKQADLGLAWVRSEVQGAVAARDQQPDAQLVREVLQSIHQRSPETAAVFYYVADDPGAPVLALGGGIMGAPRLPWYARGLIQLDQDAPIELGSQSLTGRHGRLIVSWHGRNFDLGGLAVFYPNYRGRGPSVVRPLKELILFFLVLFGACAGIVLFTVAQFVKPIRMLEHRADGMARGELAQPVSSGGEGDEIGRLTFALEEMRRALREKLRSTEEVNLDLERAVQRRTADLAKKNRELAETLEKLTRAQDQLVRSEKMASIGQLVAGIAHEINNPVNAIVNTVAPLEQSLDEIDTDDATVRTEAKGDMVDMLRVMRRGAERTKAIVQALHNYSRTDDESVVAVDINRSLDDSLELLRHLLKQSIAVERDYGDVGRIRGHAGQLGQVFMNLLTNAAQAAAGRDDATIRIATREEAGGVVIEIRDNGQGIAPDVLSRIFDPFFTTKDVGEGSGLGLSIVHGIVERHGGTIEVDSTVGQGTCFSVHLPRGESNGRPGRQTGRM